MQTITLSLRSPTNHTIASFQAITPPIIIIRVFFILFSNCLLFPLAVKVEIIIILFI